MANMLDHRFGRRAAAWCVVAVLAAGGLGACGGTDDGDKPAPAGVAAEPDTWDSPSWGWRELAPPQVRAVNGPFLRKSFPKPAIFVPGPEPAEALTCGSPNSRQPRTPLVTDRYNRFCLYQSRRVDHPDLNISKIQLGALSDHLVGQSSSEGSRQDPGLSIARGQPLQPKCL